MHMCIDGHYSYDGSVGLLAAGGGGANTRFDIQLIQKIIVSFPRRPNALITVEEMTEYTVAREEASVLR